MIHASSKRLLPPNGKNKTATADRIFIKICARKRQKRTVVSDEVFKDCAKSLQSSNLKNTYINKSVCKLSKRASTLSSDDTTVVAKSFATECCLRHGEKIEMVCVTAHE